MFPYSAPEWQFMFRLGALTIVFLLYFRVSFFIFTCSAIVVGDIGSIIATYCFYKDTEQPWYMHVSFIEGAIVVTFLELIGVAVVLASVMK